MSEQWRQWLDAELERIWLASELLLRRLQQAKLRPASNTDVEAALARRRLERTGAAGAPDAAEMTAALDALKPLDALRGPVLARLATLGLTPRDVDALLLVAAPSIDPELGELFALLRGAATRRGVDLAFIGDALEADRVAGLGPAATGKPVDRVAGLGPAATGKPVDRVAGLGPAATGKPVDRVAGLGPAATGKPVDRAARVALLDFLDDERAPLACRLIQVAPPDGAPASHRAIHPSADLLWLLTATAAEVSPSLRRTAQLVRADAAWDGLYFDGATRARLEPLARRFALPFERSEGARAGSFALPVERSEGARAGSFAVPVEQSEGARAGSFALPVEQSEGARAGSFALPVERSEGARAGSFALPVERSEGARAGSFALPVERSERAGDAALPWVALWGAPGSGKRTIAARLAGFAGKPLIIVDPRPADKAQLPEIVRRACRDACWLGAVLYLGPLAEEQLFDDKAVVRELERALSPVLLGFDASVAPRLHTTHPLAELALPVPSAPTRAALWHQALAGARLAHDADVEVIARGYKLTPGEIHASAREALALAGDAPLDGATLRGVMERRLRNELGAVATRVIVETSWADIVLPPDAEARVRELIARKRFEDQVYRAWGLDQRITYGKGIIGLFSGPPGTGKTLLAGLIAQELGFELYQVDLSQIFSRWIGETEKALARVFDQAERAHAVLLFDEADALFAKRTEVEDSRDRFANVAVNYLLQRLERYSGVAILTTNKDAYLDEALRRRLSLHLHLEEPEVPERLRLWEKHLPTLVPGASSVDLVALASDYVLSGGYIKNVALRASFLSAAEDVPLSTEQVRRAAILELEDMGRVVLWPPELEGQQADYADYAADYVEG